MIVSPYRREYTNPMGPFVIATRTVIKLLHVCIPYPVKLEGARTFCFVAERRQV